MGRADALLLPKPQHGHEALLLAYKVAKEPGALDRVAQAGLRQLQEKSYRAKVRAYAHVRRYSGGIVSLLWQGGSRMSQTGGAIASNPLHELWGLLGTPGGSRYAAMKQKYLSIESP